MDNLLQKGDLNSLDKNQVFQTLINSVNELKQFAEKVTGQKLSDQLSPLQYGQVIYDYLDGIIAEMPGHVYWEDKHGVSLGCNDQQARSAGFTSRKEMIGKTDYDFPWKEQADILQSVNKEVMTTGQIHVVEEPSTLADGSYGIFLSHKKPLRNQAGEIIGILGISFDITERKALEKQLKETEIREKIQRERIREEAMNTIADSIAHELRTPLRSIANVLFGVSKKLPDLIDAYRIVKPQKLDMPLIAEETLSEITQGLDLVKREINYTNSIIDMLLMSLKEPHMDNNKFIVLSMKACVSGALNHYAFKEENEAKLVHWKDANDFQFIGDGLLITHIVFNLLRNALFFVQKAAKGDVNIWLERGEKFNELHVKDTGAGISSDVLPYIFDRFFTHRQGGTGVGLAFCQSAMKDMGGDIQCESSLGEYTEFIMTFPVVK
jgi:PAS domain S-box-containing protein